MAFKAYEKLEIGDQVMTERVFESLTGYFEKGSIVVIKEIGPRGYTIEDHDGNRISECGWTGLKKV